jgi:cysteine desulfurase
MSDRCYLDHNATSPLRPEARDAMNAALDCIGNPSSIHAEGRAARAIVERARESVAAAFDAAPAAVAFTSSGTEAANWLLQPFGGRRLIVSEIEHSCVLKGHRFPNGEFHTLAVSARGVADLAALENALAVPSLVAVQAANNETGVIQPVADVARLARAHGAFFGCDATQAVGRLPLSDLREADALFFSAHKFGGPKGAGAVVWRSAEPMPPPLIRGGGQERRQRSGTENVAAIAGLAAALAAAGQEQVIWKERAEALQLRLEQGLRAIAPGAVVFGEDADRLPNTTCFALPGKGAEMLLIALDLDGVAVSSGSACSSGKVERSHVLAAMGVAPGLSDGAIRISTGWNTAAADVERFLAVLSKICGARETRHAA